MSKREISKILFAAGIVFIFAGIAYGQGVRQAWVEIYDGPQHGDDAVADFAVDDSGFVYVTGTSYDWGVAPNEGYRLGAGANWVTIKYDSLGNTVWERLYKGPADSGAGASAIARDKSGHIYVGGWSWNKETLSDFAIIKYSTEGDTVWARTYNGSGKSYDRVTGLAVDDSGNVFVTGWSASGGHTEYLTIKCAPDGDTLWVRRYSGNWMVNQPTAMAVGPDGYIYVTGVSDNRGTGPDYVTIKYAPNGDSVWTRSYSGQVGARKEYPTALAVDSYGYVYVTGQSGNACATIKYSPSGDTVWVRRLSGPVGSIAVGHDLKVDKGGFVYVAGEGESDIPHKLSDYLTIKYTSDGKAMWVRFYDGPRNEGGDYARALAIDADGNVYVTGYSDDPKTMLDIVTIKYAGNGDIIWVTRCKGPRLGDSPSALKIDKRGNVYVTGNSGSGGGRIFETRISRPGNRDFVTIKYVQCPPESPLAGKLIGCLPINVRDVIYLVNYVFDKDRPETGCRGADSGNCWTPSPLCTGEVDGIPPVDVADVYYLVNHVFDRDRPETDCAGSDPYNCWTPVATGACCQPAQEP